MHASTHHQHNWFTITALNHHLYAFRESSHWEDVVSYLLIGANQAFLIDTGMGVSSMRQVVSSITDKPVTVLLTHSHWDHIGSVHEFDEVWAFNHSYEVAQIRSGFNSKDIEELEPSYFLQKEVAKSFTAPGNSAAHTFDTSHVFSDSHFKIEIIHTPGHTPGSVCFWVPELGYLFTGDTLYPGPEYVFLPESDFILYQQSLQTLSDLVTTTPQKNVTLYPGHNATSESVELLHHHYLAASGKLIPNQRRQGSNTYGEYLEYVYEGFSILVPPGTELM